MSILIKGMEMPKDGRITIQIGADGAVYFVEKCTIMAEKYEKSSHAVPLPEWHGRLIDADALIDALETQDYSCAPDTLEDWTPQDMTVAEIADITHAPTIVPAEGGEADG